MQSNFKTPIEKTRRNLPKQKTRPSSSVPRARVTRLVILPLLLRAIVTRGWISAAAQFDGPYFLLSHCTYSFIISVLENTTSAVWSNCFHAWRVRFLRVTIAPCVIVAGCLAAPSSLLPFNQDRIRNFIKLYTTAVGKLFIQPLEYQTAGKVFSSLFKGNNRKCSFFCAACQARAIKWFSLFLKSQSAGPPSFETTSATSRSSKVDRACPGNLERLVRWIYKYES